VPARVGVEVVLDLGDVALEASAEREQPRHLLFEELGGVRLGAVDPRGPAHHDRPQAGYALTRGEQLQRAHHVDVMHRPRRHPRARLPHDLLVHDRVGAGLGDELRDLGVADVRLDELGALERQLRAPRVEARDMLHVRVALEPGGEKAADVAADAGDQHPAAGH
jgi:hypothetical protein